MGLGRCEEKFLDVCCGGSGFGFGGVGVVACATGSAVATSVEFGLCLEEMGTDVGPSLVGIGFGEPGLAFVVIVATGVHLGVVGRDEIGSCDWLGCF
eukprot:scaffold4774_cov95-Cylindrotheca_fusiformis.AAC.2